MTDDGNENTPEVGASGVFLCATRGREDYCRPGLEAFGDGADGGGAAMPDFRL
jgi:hypothetical protein